jgi:predicted Zn-dependent peptidase
MERLVVLEELAQSEDQPEEVAVQQLLAMACPGHAYGLPILGHREALLAHEPEAMAAFHRRLYGGGRCVLALAGALAGRDLEARAAEGALASLAPLAGPPPLDPLRVQPGERRLELPRLEAARLLMAWGQPPARDLHGVMGADLATSLLAEGRRSRLVARLREQLQLVESVDLDLHPMECGSLALLEAVCDPDDLPAVRAAIHTVWEEVMAEPVQAAEWSRIRRLVTNSYRFGMEAPGNVAGLIGTGHLWGRYESLEAPLEAIDSWTPDTLRTEALASLDPRRACVLEAVPA